MIDYVLDFENKGFVCNAVEKANSLKSILKLCFITKLMDDHAIHTKTEKTIFPTKADLIDYIMFRYGDIVK